MSVIIAFDHVQLAMPAGREDDARAFYEGVLGLRERTKPPALAARGGCWFGSGAVEVHLGIDPDFKPARKAHPAFAENLAAMRDRLRTAGFLMKNDVERDGVDRLFVDDPFGNRIELLQRR